MAGTPARAMCNQHPTATTTISQLVSKYTMSAYGVLYTYVSCRLPPCLPHLISICTLITRYATISNIMIIIEI